MAGKYNKVIQFGKLSLKKLVSSLQRFPETLLLCAATAVVLMILNHQPSGSGEEAGEFMMRLAAVLALGIPLSLCLKVYFEKTPHLKTALKGLLYVAAAAGLVLYHSFLLQDFEMVSLTRYVAVTLALYLAFTVIPYLHRRENYELYMIKLFISFFITYLFASVLLGGLSAILGTVGYLFSIKIPVELYSDISLVVGGIFAPAFFLADIPLSGQDPDPKSYPRVISVLLSYILMPLLLAYGAILYLYLIKVLATQQWPEIMVSHLVLWYAIISTLVLFGIYPQRRESRWNEIFTSFFPKLLLPLLVLMFTAMAIRINAYGITESRYFVLAVGLWVTGSMLYLIFSKKPKNVLLPASLALVAALSVFGPWSSYSLSICSQNRRFDKIAAEYNLIHDGEIVESADLPEETKEELSSILFYFDRHHGLDRLHALPRGLELDKIETLLGFALYEQLYAEGEDEALYFFYSLDPGEAYFEISDFDYFMHFYPEENSHRAGAFEAAYSPEEGELRIALQGAPAYSQDVAAIAEKIHLSGAAEENRELLSLEEASYTEEHGNLRLLYIFTSIGGWENRLAKKTDIDYVEFHLFIGLD